MSLQRSNLILASLIFALVLGVSTAQGAVSYLSIQGEFDSFSAGVETYKWKVDYTGSSLVTGQDLLNAIFGAPVLVSGSTYMAGNTNHGVLYTFYSGLGYSPQRFYTDGLAGPLTPPLWNGTYWAYFNAGGAYDDGVDITPYDDALWGYANTGGADRILADSDLDVTLNEPSFNAYVFGTGVTPSGNPSSTFTGLETLFSSGTGYNVYSIAAAPEPSRSLLLLLAGIALITRRRRSFSAAC